jgi:hypothetical protein
LIGEEHFTSQCRDGGTGRTEFVHFELNEKYKLRSSFVRGGEGKTKSFSSKLHYEGTPRGAGQRDGKGKTEPVPMNWIEG